MTKTKELVEDIVVDIPAFTNTLTTDKYIYTLEGPEEIVTDTTFIIQAYNVLKAEGEFDLGGVKVTVTEV